MTGYTEGVANGTTKTFKEYAFKCLRAFGAAIHLRDESLDTEYTPREPQPYYKDIMEEKIEELEAHNKLTDEEFEAIFLKELEEKRDRYLGYVKKEAMERERLEVMLEEARNFEVPSEDYQNFKDFMVNQLMISLPDSNGFYIEELGKTLVKISDLNIQKERDLIREDLVKDIEYNRISYEKELAGCKKSNEWVEVLFKAIK